MDNSDEDPVALCAKAFCERIEKLLNLLTDSRPCKKCGRLIWILKNRNGKYMPITDEGTNHFIDCPHAKEFRKPS